MDTTDLIMLYDYYGELLTDRQKECFELRYYQDFSLGEIGQELGISRQGVHDNLSRTEQLLLNMEAKTGCVQRDLQCRKVMETVRKVADSLSQHHDTQVTRQAKCILDAIAAIKE